jgi:hypothetical protein
MKSSELLDSLQVDSEEMSSTFQSTFFPLSDNQLNWKPSTKGWSILECIEHIIVTGEYYLEEIENKFSRVKPESKPMDINFQSSLFGNFSANSMKPSNQGVIRYKMKTMKRMEPGQSIIDRTALFRRYEKYQQRILTIIERSKYYNINKIKITSSIGKLLRFNLGNTIRFVVAHNQRHIQQALNVAKNKYFPKD